MARNKRWDLGVTNPLKGRPHPPDCAHCAALAEKSRAIFTPGSDRPTCRCHGQPMRWQKYPRLRGGGHWRCVVREAAYQRVGRLKKFGITEEHYAEMLKKQGGKCAICRKPPEKRWNRLAVDHDHETGKVRGLLCMVCNTMLGRLQSRWNQTMHYLRVSR